MRRYEYIYIYIYVHTLIIYIYTYVHTLINRWSNFAKYYVLLGGFV